jgi:hypothetical protein
MLPSLYAWCLAERQDPGGCGLRYQWTLEDERVTILQTVTILEAAMDKLDESTP